MRTSLLVISAVFFFGALHLGLIIYQNDWVVEQVLANTFLGLLSLSFVSFGWYVTLYVASRNNALTLLYESRLSEVYQQKLAILGERIPDGSKLTDKDIEKDEQLHEIVRYVLNYVELICVGMRFGDLAEKPVRMMMAGPFQSLYGKTSRYIQYEKDRIGRDEVYEHFTHFVTKWKSK